MRLLVNEFKRGRTSIEDAPCPKKPKSAVMPKNIDSPRYRSTGRRVEVRELAEAVDILVDQGTDSELASRYYSVALGVTFRS